MKTNAEKQFLILVHDLFLQEDYKICPRYLEPQSLHPTNAESHCLKKQALVIQ